MPELRKDPLTRRWVIIATERANRPLDFSASQPAPQPAADCPFCEGREGDTRKEIYAVRAKAGSAANSGGWQVRVIPSLNPVLRVEGNLNRRAEGMYDVMDGVGAHEMIIECPHHENNLAELSIEQIAAVLTTATTRMEDLSKDQRFRYVLWFKNHGSIAGAGRIAHARSQLIATPITPKLVKEELIGARRYYEEKDRCLLCDLIRQEQEGGSRIVLESREMIALSPFAARFPFEVWILPKVHSCDFQKASPAVLVDMAGVLKGVLLRLKSVLDNPSYNIVLHTAPFRHQRERLGHWKTLEDDFHWHLELIPRLARVAGFEWGSGFYINPTPPEQTANYLRNANV